jgi:hypothetical protein
MKTYVYTKLTDETGFPSLVKDFSYSKSIRILALQ